MEDTGKITVTDNGSGIVVTGSGSLDLYISKEFADALMGAVKKSEAVIVDLRSAAYIDTAILSDLVLASRAMSEKGRKLRVLVSAGGHPERTIDVTGLTEILDMVVEGTSS